MWQAISVKAEGISIFRIGVSNAGRSSNNDTPHLDSNTMGQALDLIINYNWMASYHIIYQHF